MVEIKPCVSIGLPVYNGEKYLEGAINSILSQTFSDFELIISDNASTDRTAEICNKYAAQDARIRYYRNENNIGGGNNHALTYQLSKGKYFRWANDDDACAPEFLAKCVEALEQNPSVVLSYSRTIIIDENGKFEREIAQPIATSTRPYGRFRVLTRRDLHDCEPFYGLIRSSVMADISRKTGINLNYTDSDRVLLCQISLYGQFFQVPDPLFYKRYHPGASTILYPDWRKRVAWFFPNTANRLYLPFWSQFIHYIKSIAVSPISLREKSICYLHMGHWLLLEKGMGLMIKDLIYAGVKFLKLSHQKLQNTGIPFPNVNNRLGQKG